MGILCLLFRCINLENENDKERFEMAHMIEKMFSVREKPWHGLGTIVMETPTSADALRLAGLDWNVVQESVYTDSKEKVEGYKVNIRDFDRKVLGVVSDRYRVVQNVDAFSFTDGLLGKGVRYETAGSLQNGKRVWLLARLPKEYIIAGERINPYLVFSNTHDGSSSVKVAITPVRVVCNNTLNLALDTTRRSFSMIHTGNVQDKIQEARDTLFMAEKYMDNLGVEFEQLRRQKVTDAQVKEYVELLLPMEKEPTPVQSKNILRLRDDIMKRYYDAPDLKKVGNNAYRFINAVSDFATHAEPLRRTVNYKENLFGRIIDGNPLIDKAYQLVKAA